MRWHRRARRRKSRRYRHQIIKRNQAIASGINDSKQSGVKNDRHQRAAGINARLFALYRATPHLPPLARARAHIYHACMKVLPKGIERK